MNKKPLIAIVTLLVVAAAGVFAYMQMSSKKDYLGTWKVKSSEEGTNGEIEFTKDKIIINGSFQEINVKLTTDYKDKGVKDGVYTLEASNPKVELSGKTDILTDEEKKELTEGTEKAIKDDNTLQFKLSDDKKELTQVDDDGSTKDVYVKK